MVKCFAFVPRLTASSSLKLRLSYYECTACLVKTASFLTHSLTAYREEIRPYKESVPKIILVLLKVCMLDHGARLQSVVACVCVCARSHAWHQHESF